MCDGPQIRQLMKDKAFPNSMNETERQAWLSFVSVVENFLGNTKSDDYRNIVETMLKNYHKLGLNMTIKVQFPDDLGAGRAFSSRYESYGREIPKTMGYPHDGRLLREYSTKMLWKSPFQKIDQTKVWFRVKSHRI